MSQAGEHLHWPLCPSLPTIYLISSSVAFKDASYHRPQFIAGHETTEWHRSAWARVTGGRVWTEALAGSLAVTAQGVPGGKGQQRLKSCHCAVEL